MWNKLEIIFYTIGEVSSPKVESSPDSASSVWALWPCQWGGSP